MPVTFTQAEIDAFKQALLDRKGATSISFGDQVVQFESHDKAVAFLAYMERNISPAATTTGRVRYAATSKGV